MAEAELKDEKMCVCYSLNTVSCLSKKMTVVNGTGESYIAVRANGNYSYLILNCKGEKISEGEKSVKDIAVFDVPESGVLKMYEQ